MIKFYDILAWLFPNKCLICGNYIKASECICDNCKDLDTLYFSYNVKVKRQAKFMHCYASYVYKDLFQKHMIRFKFLGKTSYARKFIKFLLLSFKDFPFENYQSICYVPMLPKAKKERGYNQAELLAKELSKELKIPLNHSLKKIKENKIQHSLNAKDRLENVKGVYGCMGDIKGQNIILIDDIITTGATLCQCAKVLYENGANNVVSFAVASTAVPTENDKEK